MSAQREAYVTLCTNEAYISGAVVLAYSLKSSGTSRELVCLTTSTLSRFAREMLQAIFDVLVDVDLIDTGDKSALALLGRPELGITATKIACWTLTQFSKCVFLDADTLVLSNIDDLFTRPELAAAPDVGWPDCFNSGVFVFVPSVFTFNGLSATLASQGSFDGGDQGLLNQYFSTWSTSSSEHRLPFGYNMTANTSYGYAPAYEQYRHTVKVVHFIGSIKPWHQARMGSNSDTPRYNELVQKWWEVKGQYDASQATPDRYNLLPPDQGMIDLTLNSQQPYGTSQTHSQTAQAPEPSGPAPAPSGPSLQPGQLAPGEVFNPTVSYSFSEIQRLIDAQIEDPPADPPADQPKKD